MGGGGGGKGLLVSHEEIKLNQESATKITSCMFGQLNHAPTPILHLEMSTRVVLFENWPMFATRF